MNTLTNLLILVLLVLGVIKVPVQIWFGRPTKPVLRQIRERDWNFKDYKSVEWFDNIDQMYWYIIDTKKGEVFEYTIDRRGRVTMYIIE